MPAEELEKTTDIDPDALMREYKQTGSLEVRNQLVMYYSYIARSMAVKMSSTYHKYATTEEMVNQCVIALINSLERFDPDKGVKFSTYAFTKVRGAIIDYPYPRIISGRPFYSPKTKKNELNLQTC